MQIGMIGLGRMGMNMARRLLGGNHEVVVYNRTQEKVKELAKEGAIPSESVADLAQKLSPRRVVWIMLPAGETTDKYLEKTATYLSEGDILIDGGNSFYKDDIRRSQVFANLNLCYMDAGISGGVWGLKMGYCTMMGGNKECFDYIEPLLKTLAPKEGYLYCGPAGAGHYVKMVHNGIEYAIMEAYGEGYDLLRASPYSEYINFRDISHLWNQGSVIRSWLLELLESAFEKDPLLESIEAFVEDSGEGRWTVQQAVESGVSATAIAHSLFKRFQSRQPDLFSDKILAALRNEFGGHALKKKS
jgi:6-phosphogluconate dehydrogenase